MSMYQNLVLEILKNKLQAVEQNIENCNNKMQFDYIAAYEKDITTQLVIYHKVQTWLLYQYNNTFVGDLTNDNIYHEVMVHVKWITESIFKMKSGVDKWVIQEKLEVLKEIVNCMKDDYKFPIGDFIDFVN